MTFPRVWGNWQQWCDNDRLKLLKSTEGEKEMKIYHGAILTVNEKNEVFEYLVEYRGKIVYTGNELPKKYKHAEVIELGNRALIPPFADTHQHLASFSAFHAGLNVMEAASNREILDMVRDFASAAEGKTLIAFGASPYSVAEGRLVSREELDEVTFGKPLFMVKYDGHAGCFSIS